MNLENITPIKGSNKKASKRLGRGQGSGKGGTSTRGHKGAKSRSGYSKKIGFEGGQMPLQRRVPKFGFKNVNRLEYQVLNLESIQQLILNKKIKDKFSKKGGKKSRRKRKKKKKTRRKKGGKRKKTKKRKSRKKRKTRR